ncbi:MAG: outer membrane protein assembly factor BamA, partial [bacterium]|nr:outer membrane protein assembly factor BamA [bacterium]
REVLQSKQKGDFSWLTSRGKYQDEFLARDAALLTYHYLNEGYLKVRVDQPRVYLSRDRKWIFITFKVVEGDPYTLRSIDVEGDILTTKEELLGKMKVKVGKLYSRKTVDEDIRTLSALYGDHGYAFTNINPITIPDEATKTATISYAIDKGPRVTIEKINISGNTITRDKVIRRELRVVEGSLYSETELNSSRQRLQALGYFEEVNFAMPRGSGDDTIVLNITVKEKPTGTFTIGAGFSTVENFIFSSSISKNNFFGYGISGQFSTELSSRRQLFVLSFEDPYFLDSKWILGISGFRTVDRYTDFNRDSFGGTLSLGHRFFDYSSVRLTYQAESVNIGHFSTIVPAPFENTLSGLTSSLGMSVQRDTRDNRLIPKKGSFNQASNEFSGRRLGGDNDFYRLSLNSRYYYPIFWKVVAKTNASLGYIQSLNDSPVPLFERFFQGGPNSLRGYYLRSIAPKVQIPTVPQGNDSEFAIGGDKMVQFNAELEAPLYEPAGFALVTFYDAGNTFAEDQSFSVTDLRSDYGFGIRWNSPFGPMRFEWGFPINPQ